MNADFGFQRPLGLVLSGGGALAAWQAGCLNELVQKGLAFDHVLGFSSGALNGALYFLGRDSEYLAKWREIEALKVMRFAPSWRSWTLFSNDPIWATVDFARDDQVIRRDARCLFTIVSLCADDGMPAYSRFSPLGKGAWDAPLASWLVASCSIPRIFPPILMKVRGEPHVFVDGGIPGQECMRFDALAGCRDVIVLEMVRPDEIGMRWWSPVARFDQKAREVLRRQIDSGVDSLNGLAQPPRVFRLHPSQRLDYYQLSFKAKNCIPALDLGISDGTRFLQSPEIFCDNAAGRP